MLLAPRRVAAAACLALLVAWGPTWSVHAQENLVRQAVSEDAAVALVRQQTDGKVVRVERSQVAGMLVYRIRVLTPDGRLREYRVDAATGALR